jgi:predicted ATPase/DNA-binding SARP family transcriptional activator
MSSELRLSLLGKPEISRDGGPLEGFAQQKSLALLGYLAVTGQPYTRAALAGLLWGEATEANALAGLRKALADLRRQVAPYLTITRQQVAFNRNQPYWLDVETFERQVGEIDAIQEAEMTPTGMIMPADAAKLAAAVDLYRGEFLAGFYVRRALAFEEWVLLLRERLRLTALRALHILASHYMAQGTYPQAIEYTRRILALEPCQEEAHRQMMSALALSGQREAALRQYQACCRALAEEMGTAPQEETTALFQRIRDGGSPASRAPAFAQNLPCPITPMIGRKRERDEIITRLRAPDCRLLTLVGPGGCGKTRLAQEVAATFTSPTLSAGSDAQPEEVYLVTLAPLQSAESLVPAIAHGIGLLFSSEGDPRQELLNYLHQKRLLLILDNFEHLLSPPLSPPFHRGEDEGFPPRGARGMKGGANLVSEILAAAPDVKILVTSRARLNLQAEQLYPLAGIDAPTPPLPYGHPPRRAGGTERGNSASGDAVQLFLWGARKINTDIEPTPDDYGAIGQICRLVEGMPLAILLAASWARMLTPAEIAAQLTGTVADAADGPLDFLETDWGDVPARQRSMRAVFDHSWNLLTEREREVLAALSVFRGGFTNEAAWQVAGASLHDLATLVDRSLLHRAQGRYGMHELLHQYAADRLRRADRLRQAKELESVQNQHSAYYADRLQTWAADLKSDRQIAVVEEMEVEIANARAAWDWMVRQGDLAQIDRAMEGLCLFYQWRVRYAEGESACRAVIQHLSSSSLPAHDQEKGEKARIQAKALTWQSAFSNPERAGQLLQECLALLDGPDLIGGDTRAERAFASYRMAIVFGADHERAQQSYEKSIALYQSLEDRWGLANALNGLGTVLWDRAAYDEAKQLHGKSLAIYWELGDQRGVACSLGRLGTLALLQGQIEGERLVRESIAIYQEIGDRASMAYGFYIAGMALMTLGAFDEAHALLDENVAVCKDMGARSDIADVMQSCAKVHLGQYEQGRAQAEDGLNEAREADNSLNVGFALIVLGWEALTRKAYNEAQTLFQESADTCQSVEHQDMLGWALAFLGYADRELGQVTRTREHLHQALRIAAEIQSFSGLLFTLSGIALLLSSLGHEERAVELYALASRHSAVTNSHWFADVVGQPIAAVAAKLPPDVATAAEERGRARDLEATVAELLAELEEGITPFAPQAPGGSRRAAAG